MLIVLKTNDGETIGINPDHIAYVEPVTYASTVPINRTRSDTTKVHMIDQRVFYVEQPCGDLIDRINRLSKAKSASV